MSDVVDRDYQALIERIADQEPRQGYQSILEIKLTDEDLITVIRHEPDVVADALIQEPAGRALLSARVCAALALTSNDECFRQLGRILYSELKPEAQKLVLRDVTEECQRREAERESRSGRQVAADQAGLPAWGPL